MSQLVTKVIAGAVIWATIAAATALAEQFDPQAIEFFENEIRPLLVERCFKCHGDGTKPKGGLKLTRRAAILAGGDTGPAAVPGKPTESLLVEAIEYRDSLQMPPDARLNDKQIELLTKWVALGLPWPEPAAPPVAAQQTSQAYQFTDEQRAFWSFQPIRVIPPGEVKNTTWSRSTIDRYVLAQMEAHGLSPAAPAERRAVLRRATFDLTGLPPTLSEIEAFLGDDAPDAFARVVDRLLASPAYGERWGRHWLDVVRYADCKDLRDIGQPYDIVESYRYRDWVVAALNRDLPYDQFAIDQIAGDLIAAREPGTVNADGIVATGMLTIGPWGPGDADTQKMHADMVDDQINVVSRAMLGLTVGCARCHDHKFDPIPTADYYSLAGIFFSTQIALPAISAPYNKVALVPQSVVDHVNQHAARTSELEKQIQRFADEQFIALRKTFVAETGRYLLAAWDYRHRTQDKAAQTPLAFAAEHQLRGEALGQWLDYLGLASGDSRLMSNILRDHGAKGVFGWKGEASEPILLVNTNDEIVNVPGTMPPRSVAVHPSPVAGVAVAWRSPIAGTVDIGGKVVDAHAACGNGVDWLVEQRKPQGAATLASGSIANGGGQPIGEGTTAERLRSVGVEVGDVLQLVVLPKQEYSCDLTTVEFEISEHGGQQRTWSVTQDIVPDVRDAEQSNPHHDRFGNPEVWHFLDLDPAHGSKRADRGANSPLAAWFETTKRVDDATGARADLERVAAEIQKSLNDASLLPVPAAIKPGEKVQVPVASPGQQLYQELVSDESPFRVKNRDENLLSLDARTRLQNLRSEFDGLKKNVPSPIPYAMAATEGGVPGTKYAGFHDAAIHVRGRYDRLGEVVPRRFPRIVAGEKQPAITEGSGRLQLARWIASPRNPLTARVIVNRLWQHHFGEGIVRTAGNFGKLGERPTHPELLDYLAASLIEQGWSLKAMHREMMLSATYLQSSHVTREGQTADPENRWLSRMNMRRLEAEAIRDSLIFVSGKLDRALGGRPTRDLASTRRTMYLMTVRSDKAGFPFLFDTADPENIVDERTISTVAPQALFLLNNPFALAQVSPIVERVLKDAGASDAEKIERFYLLLYGRPPTPAEIELGDQYLIAARAKSPADEGSRAAWEQYCQALLCANEFIYIE